RQERAVLETRLAAEVEKAKLEAAAAAARHGSDMELVIQAARLEQAKTEMTAARRQTLEEELLIAQLEAKRTELQLELELKRTRALKDVENTVSPEVIQLMVAQQLPQIAAGFAQKMGNVNVTAIDGANPFGFVAAAVDGVMSLAKNAGLKMPEVKNAPDRTP
ncbi:MAG: hypothetical protein ACJ790_00955, partial [Myxococcaceae bacterium]